jgi:midasin (ATPase involved in ribosome maturation)
MPDYVMYFINLHPLNIVCKRNYEDFTKLKATLAEIYPGIRLAYLEKNSWFSSTNIEFIKKQKTMLAFFINDLIKNNEIRNSRVFEEFVTLQEHKQIKRKFE